MRTTALGLLFSTALAVSACSSPGQPNDAGNDVSSARDTAVSDATAPVDAGVDVLTADATTLPDTTAQSDAGADVGAPDANMDASTPDTGTDVPVAPVDTGVDVPIPPPVDAGGLVLLRGGIGTLGPAPTPGAAFSIVDDGFETGTTLCAGSGLCVTGSVTP